jgi:RNA polymerase sigma factor (sigma-70 family)
MLTIEDKLRIARMVAGRIVRRARHLDLDDLTQDGMLQILKSDPWDGRGEEGAYYAVLARWACLRRIDDGRHWCRRIDRCQRVPLAPDLVAQRPMQERQAEGRARVVRLRHALIQLPPRQRFVVKRHCLDGATPIEVARELGTTVRAMQQLLCVARRRLKQHVMVDAA